MPDHSLCHCAIRHPIVLAITRDSSPCAVIHRERYNESQVSGMIQ
jgi:hypothetical protein